MAESRLFTYTIPVDDGAAPNPFNGICTLAICKPRIRSTARPGDWVAGLGSKNAPTGDLSGRLVYAMKVEEVLTLSEYDAHSPSRWPHRIPNVDSPALQDRLGDCIYDFSAGAPTQRRGVHSKQNQEKDLRGKNVLISQDYYYFGCNAIAIPPQLLGILHQTQGHKSNSNSEHFAAFDSWIRSIDPRNRKIFGWPGFIAQWNDEGDCFGCNDRDDDDDELEANEMIGTHAC